MEQYCEARGIELPGRRASRGLMLLRRLCLTQQYPKAALWIHVCLTAKPDRLVCMCKFLELEPTKRQKQGSKQGTGLMRKVLLKFVLETPDIATTRHSSRLLSPLTPPEEPNNVGVETLGLDIATVVVEAEPVVDINIGIVGMWWERPNPKDTHPDMMRMDALDRILAGGVRLVAITMEEKARPTPNQAVLDIRSVNRGWRSRLEDVDTILNREIFLLIVDYFYIPSEYYGTSKQGLGYGLNWITKFTSFFSWGGGMALMPNDKHGRLKDDLGDTDWWFELTQEDAANVHPLFIATASITGECGRLIGVTDPQHVNRGANREAIKQWLDEEHPFLLCYNKLMFDEHAALAWLQGLLR